MWLWFVIIIIIMVIAVIISIVVILICKYGKLTLQCCCPLPPPPAINSIPPALKYCSCLSLVMFHSLPCSAGLHLVILSHHLGYMTELICSGSCKEIPQTGGWSNRNVLSPSSGGWESKIKVWVLCLEAMRARSVPGLCPGLVVDCLIPVSS